MNFDQSSIESAIKVKIIAIAASLGSDATGLRRDELIPATGLIDSAGLLELIAWFESAYMIEIETSEFTIDNLGTLESMANFLRQRKGIA